VYDVLVALQFLDRGWPEKAPFDIIIVDAAPDHVPQPLVEQLAPVLVRPISSPAITDQAADGSQKLRQISIRGGATVGDEGLE
jgi:protein-L-isoaspartate O-methyltransferase